MRAPKLAKVMGAVYRRFIFSVRAGRPQPHYIGQINGLIIIIIMRGRAHIPRIEPNKQSDIYSTSEFIGEFRLVVSIDPPLLLY
jgi:hypothetical protein